MIHYHGTRLAMTDQEAARALFGRHAPVSHVDTSQLAFIARAKPVAERVVA